MNAQYDLEEAIRLAQENKKNEVEQYLCSIKQH